MKQAFQYQESFSGEKEILAAEDPVIERRFADKLLPVSTIHRLEAVKQ